MSILPEDSIVSNLFTTGNVSFRSCDGVLLRTDQWRLEFVAEGFPLDIRPGPDEVVVLNEDSNTLEMLFTFLYPNREMPNIGALSFDALVKLLEAADKYAFNAALEIGLSHLQRYAQSWPLRILTLAGRHNDGPLLAALAPHLVNLKPEVIEIVGFSTSLCAKWSRYRKKWLDTMVASKEILNGHDAQCDLWRNRIHAHLITGIDSPVVPIYRLVRGTNTKGQKAVWELYENVMEKIENELIENGDRDRVCCKYELLKWFDHVADGLGGIQFL
ncbi:hypothetical protein EV361DRAFT_873362 [Lentinula raphanica]|nr:hypothetical protein EV361DRAFT_873362 [Lentinula raphanica]